MHPALAFLLGIVLLVALVPLIVWAGTGSWRHALHALKEYAWIMGGGSIAVGALALVLMLADVIG